MNGDGGTSLYWQRGGSALLADLISELAERAGGWHVQQPKSLSRTGPAADAALGPEDARFHPFYATWQPYPHNAQAEKKDKPAWRVAEFLGGRSSTQTPGEWARVAGDDPAAQLVVLDDAGLGFREYPALWPACLTAPGVKPWVVVKVSGPVAQGRLWDSSRSDPGGSIPPFPNSTVPRFTCASGACCWRA
jgi:hypothetical protein